MSEATKVFSSKQEKMVADVLGGYPIGGSGAFAGAPGDVKTYDWLVECKTHTEPDQNIFFDLAVWKKIENEAMAMHRRPVLIVDDGSQKENKTWCLCRASNINLSAIISVDLPIKIRKNITCKHDKLVESLNANSKRYLGQFYEAAVYAAEWDNEEVVICPLTTFKELFEK